MAWQLCAQAQGFVRFCVAAAPMYSPCQPGGCCRACVIYAVAFVYQQGIVPVTNQTGIYINVYQSCFDSIQHCSVRTPACASRHRHSGFCKMFSVHAFMIKRMCCWSRIPCNACHARCQSCRSATSGSLIVKLPQRKPSKPPKVSRHPDCILQQRRPA